MSIHSDHGQRNVFRNKIYNPTLEKGESIQAISHSLQHMCSFTNDKRNGRAFPYTKIPIFFLFRYAFFAQEMLINEEPVI